MLDEPRSLKNPEVRNARHKMLEKDHIKPLTQFVERICREKNHSQEIPYLDPLDGGVNARCLCVLQDPGSKTQLTGFVSRNNPDPTAGNIYNFYQEAKIPRKDTLIWNVVPWVISSESVFWESFDHGVKYLLEMIAILPVLEVIILHGNKAKMAKRTLMEPYNKIHILDSWHTSNMVLNRYPKKRDEIKAHLQDVYKILYK